MEVAVIGAGSWGTALSIVLADNNHQVRIWGYKEDQMNEINRYHTNHKYLPDIDIPKSIVGYRSLDKAMERITTIILAVPTKAIRDVLKEINCCIKDKITVIHASKGIEPETLKRVSEVIEEEISPAKLEAVVVLSGPSHAEEVSRRQPTTVTVSSKNMESAKHAQDLFINENFRVYTNPDIIGVEIGGALKNIIALGAGISDGLGFGDNAKAALITRGLSEIARLGTKLGANPLTFAGLTGVGDLIVTCTSVHSRNWRAGNLLGKGHKLEEVLESMGMVVEGVRTTKAGYQLSKKYHVELPITTAIYEIIFNDQSPKEMVEGLMKRGRKHEMEDLANILDQRL